MPVLVVAMIFFGMISCAMAVSLALIYLSSNENHQSSESSTTIQPTEISEGSMYAISRNGEYIGYDFDSSRKKGHMCDAKNASSKEKAAPFKFTKSGDFWIVATDCDNDGNYTSYLSGTSDLIAARDKSDRSTQRWKVECSNRMDGNTSLLECSFHNKKNGKYLNGSTYTSPSFTSEKQKYKVDLL